MLGKGGRSQVYGAFSCIRLPSANSSKGAMIAKPGDSYRFIACNLYEESLCDLFGGEEEV